MFQTWHSSSSSRMHVMNHNWSSTKQRLHPQSVAEMSRHSVVWQNMALTSSDGSGWWRTLAWMVSRSCWQSTNRCTQTLHALAGTGMAVTKLYTTCNNTFHHISSKHQVHASMTATNHSVQHLHHKCKVLKQTTTHCLPELLYTRAITNTLNVTLCSVKGDRHQLNGSPSADNDISPTFVPTEYRPNAELLQLPLSSKETLTWCHCECTWNTACDGMDACLLRSR